MNIKINRGRQIKTSLLYNFEKCEMSAEDFERERL